MVHFSLESISKSFLNYIPEFWLLLILFLFVVLLRREDRLLTRAQTSQRRPKCFHSPTEEISTQCSSLESRVMASVRLLLMVALRSTTPGKGEAGERPGAQPGNSGQSSGLCVRGSCDTGSCLTPPGPWLQKLPVSVETRLPCSAAPRNTRAPEPSLDLIYMR